MPILDHWIHTGLSAIASHDEHGEFSEIVYELFKNPPMTRPGCFYYVLYLPHIMTVSEKPLAFPIVPTFGCFTDSRKPETIDSRDQLRYRFDDGESGNREVS